MRRLAVTSLLSGLVTRAETWEVRVATLAELGRGAGDRFNPYAAPRPLDRQRVGIGDGSRADDGKIGLADP